MRKYGIELVFCAAIVSTAFWFGYKYPRDLELQSTAPVEFHYEVTPEAARLLVLKGVEGCRND